MEESKKYAEAAKRYRETIELIDSQPIVDDALRYRATDRLARVYDLSGYSEKSISIYQQELVRFKSLGDRINEDETAHRLYAALLSRADVLIGDATQPGDKSLDATELGNHAFKLAADYEIDSAPALFRLVRSHYQGNDIASAALYAKKWLASGSRIRKQEMYMWLAVIDRQLGREEISKDWLFLASIRWPAGNVRNASKDETLQEYAVALICGTNRGPYVGLSIEDEEATASRLLAVYNRAPDLRRHRGYLRIQLGRWDDAAADFEIAADRDLSALSYYEVCRAWMHWHRGERAQYRSITERLVDRLVSGDVRDSDERDVVLSLALVDPGCNAEILYSLAPRASFQKGLAAYRLGNYLEAIALLRRPHSGSNETLTQLFASMAYAKLGETDSAKATLGTARLTLLLESPLPGRRRISSAAQYSNSVTWWRTPWQSCPKLRP